jgi:phosphopantothenoylcysteine decarboxylase / phosphopantothenate---cysteine ligase
MHTGMWEHAATRANVQTLRERGVRFVGPATGPLAHGDEGLGRLAEPDDVVAAVRGALEPRDLAGRRILITSGPTHEPIDPVRFIGNRSTGRMGVAIAEAATARGAQVTLVAANVEVPLPEVSATVRVETAAELREALVELVGAFDVLVMAAAVADFTPASPAGTKLERGDGLALELRPTDDILATIGGLTRDMPSGQQPPVLVGFAAETGSLDRVADKLRRKGADLMVANDVSEPGSGFGTETNRVAILDRQGGRDELPLLAKREVADRLLDRVVDLLDARDSAAQTGAVTEETHA